MDPLVPSLSCCVAIAIRWLGFRVNATRFLLPLAFTSSFVIGMLALRCWEWIPQRHWHWLPCFTVLGAVVAQLGWNPPRVWRRLTMMLALSLFTAWFIVPTWESLSPSRTVYVPLVGVCLAGLIVAHERVAVRYSEMTWLACCFITATAIAAAVTVHVSVTYGSIAVAAAAGLLGCLLAARAAGGSCHGSSLMAPYVLATAGAAWVGLIDPEPPIYLLGLLPGLPLLTIVLPMNRKRPGQMSPPNFEMGPVLVVVVGALLLGAWLWFGGNDEPQAVPWDSEW